MKRRKIALAWLLALILLLALAGCGASGSANGAGYPTTAATDGTEKDYGFDETAGTLAPNGGQEAKRIYTAELNLETTDFDAAAQGLAQAVERCGGYLSRSSVDSQGDGYRYGDYTARIPSGEFQNFLDTVGGICHVTWQSANCDDISESYYDVQGRLKTQETKLARLQELLARAESMEDIITLESAISETEEAIEALSGQLQSYDAQVDYATVNLSLWEVYRLSNTEEPAGSFGARLGTAFSSGWQGFVSAVQDIALWLAYGWVWVLVLAAAAIFGIRTWQRKRTERKLRPAPAADGQEEKRTDNEG